ncbi:hypothetical protein M5K25_008386 [Dendrobium thyrsiflorum]|uniref:Uncharacterized protein n=1 Tax=Dendrobium thyrsiflorum TaxID=117978 RepID=A0ABD0V8K2_DENTH
MSAAVSGEILSAGNDAAMSSPSNQPSASPIQEPIEGQDEHDPTIPTLQDIYIPMAEDDSPQGSSTDPIQNELFKIQRLMYLVDTKFDKKVREIRANLKHEKKLINDKYAKMVQDLHRSSEETSDSSSSGPPAGRPLDASGSDKAPALARAGAKGPDILPDHHLRPDVPPDHHLRPDVLPDPHLRPDLPPDHHLRPDVLPNHHLRPDVLPDHHLRPDVLPDHHLRPDVLPNHHLKPEVTPYHHLRIEALLDHRLTSSYEDAKNDKPHSDDELDNNELITLAESKEITMTMTNAKIRIWLGMQQQPALLAGEALEQPGSSFLAAGEDCVTAEGTLREKLLRDPGFERKEKGERLLGQVLEVLFLLQEGEKGAEVLCLLQEGEKGAKVRYRHREVDIASGTPPHQIHSLPQNHWGSKDTQISIKN